MDTVINGLLRKRSEVAGEIEAAKERISVLYQQLEHLNGTLATFGYDYSAPIKPTYKRQEGYFKQGELVRFLFDYLRQNGPQTAIQLRDAVLHHKGFDVNDPRIVRDIHKKALRAMKRQERRGAVGLSSSTGWLGGHVTIDHNPSAVRMACLSFAAIVRAPSTTWKISEACLGSIDPNTPLSLNDSSTAYSSKSIGSPHSIQLS